MKQRPGAEARVNLSRCAPRNYWPSRLPPYGWISKLGHMSNLAIQQMSWEEKLRAMEELWESLSKDEARLESPDWHGDSLRETEQRYDAGQEQPIDWAVAKQGLRDRGK